MEVAAFLSTSLGSAGAERANKDSFLKDLCDVMGVPHPNPKTGDPVADTYVFERDAITARASETTTTKFIDLYKDGCFVLKAEQGSTAVSPKLGTARRDTAGRRSHLCRVRRAAVVARRGPVVVQGRPRRLGRADPRQPDVPGSPGAGGVG